MSNIVLVWAGWTGISSLGFLFLELWYTNIIWIDANEGQIAQELEKAGVKMFIWHGNYAVQPWDIVIYSDACPTAPEVEQARELHKQWHKHAQLPYSYFQFLWEISKYFQTISIAGTHGKSTTTALLTYTMKEIDKDFALGILGALVPQLDQKNYWVAKDEKKADIAAIFSYILYGKNSEWDESLRKKYRFAIEADEFNRHFLYLDTDYAIILNAELDHADIYPNEEVYLDTFRQFVQKVKKTTFALRWEVGIDHLCEQCPEIKRIEKEQIELPYLFWDHIQKNATLLLALLKEIGQKGNSQNSYWEQQTKDAMAKFTWLWRRMELLQELPGWALLYTDYGHHPTEISAVYHAMREKHPDKKLIAIFQPHQARRVLQFWNQFTDTMQQFDEAIIYNIYAAREKLEDLLQEYPIPDHTDTDEHLLSIDQLGEMFAKKSNGVYTKEFETVLDRINRAKSNEIVCVFTAWNLDFLLRKEFTNFS